LTTLKESNSRTHLSSYTIQIAIFLTEFSELELGQKIYKIIKIKNRERDTERAYVYKKNNGLWLNSNITKKE